MLFNMDAQPIIRDRIEISDDAVAHLVVWRIPAAVPPSTHRFKYRLAYVVRDVCVLRFDNESGKGDHKHVGKTECPYAFVGIDALIADFMADIARWNDENGIV